MHEAHQFYWQAWQALRDDRHFGAMGGQRRIWFSSIAAYADRYGVVGVEFDILVRLLMEMDAEYLDYVAEVEKEQAEAAKRKDP